MFYIYHLKYGYSYFNHIGFDSKYDALCYIALFLLKRYATYTIVYRNMNDYGWTKDNPEKTAADEIQKLPVSAYKTYFPELTDVMIYDDISDNITFPTACIYDIQAIIQKGYTYLQYLSKNLKPKQNIQLSKGCVFRQTPVRGTGCCRCRYLYSPSFCKKTISRLRYTEGYVPNSRERRKYQEFRGFEHKMRHIEKSWKRNSKCKKQWEKHLKRQEIGSRDFLMELAGI